VARSPRRNADTLAWRDTTTRARGARVLCALAAALALSASSATAALGAVSAPIEARLVASEASVEAALTWPKAAGEPGGGPLPGLRLTIMRAGRAAYERPLTSPACDPCGLEGERRAVKVVALEGNGEPNVVVELATGGAHCCTIVQLFTYDPAAMTYRLFERDLGDPGALVTDVAGDGRLELESADDRFAYEFAPFAYSGLPLQIWSVRAGRLVDSTRSFPQALAADAARQLAGFRHTRHEGLGNGLIAAWAADEYLLGHRSLVGSTLAREAAHGNLRSREHYGPSGSAFVAKLKRYLKRSGYG
jgi:hypothetical protein